MIEKSKYAKMSRDFHATKNPAEENADDRLAHTPCSRSSDTPETDAASKSWTGNVMTAWNLARKLERERNESKELEEMAMTTLRQTREKYGLGNRHVTREKNRELTEAWHLLNVLCLNMMDDGPTWPRVLEWLHRNEQFRPENSVIE